MKIVGLIAEYNPFHNGHQYHIEKSKELTGADAVIIVMSGNFVQRGAPAIMPKHLRAEAALSSGADLVIELPICFSTGSAEAFSQGAITILEQLGCVDSICFGSECGDISLLKKLAKILVDEPDEYRKLLQKCLRQGYNYPSAREKALSEYLGDTELTTAISQPNNILGIEYLKALYKLNSKITPYTIQRAQSSYHDTALQENYSSASAIRCTLASSQLSDEIMEQLPLGSEKLWKTHYLKRFPIYSNDFSLLLKYKLMHETKDSLTEYVDLSEELANRIIKNLNCFVSIEQFCLLLKTKEITYSRISRALFHVLLDIKKTDNTRISYLHILGFRKDNTALLKKIKEHTDLPMLTKLTNTEALSPDDVKMLKQDVLAANLYESIVTEKYKTSFINEYEQPVIRV